MVEICDGEAMALFAVAIGDDNPDADVCRYCRNLFEKSRRDQRFCSNACRRASTAKKGSTREKYGRVKRGS
jgi:hypothetical protein